MLLRLATLLQSLDLSLLSTENIVGLHEIPKNVLFVCKYVYLYVGCVQVLKVPEDDTGSSGAGPTDSCQPPSVGVGTKTESSGRHRALLTAELFLLPNFKEQHHKCTWTLQLHWFLFTPIIA